MFVQLHVVTVYIHVHTPWYENAGLQLQRLGSAGTQYGLLAPQHDTFVHAQSMHVHVHVVWYLPSLQHNTTEFVVYLPQNRQQRSDLKIELCNWILYHYLRLADPLANCIVLVQFTQT